MTQIHFFPSPQKLNVLQYFFPQTPFFLLNYYKLSSHIALKISSFLRFVFLGFFYWYRDPWGFPKSFLGPSLFFFCEIGKLNLIMDNAPKTKFWNKYKSYETNNYVQYKEFTHIWQKLVYSSTILFLQNLTIFWNICYSCLGKGSRRSKN